MNDATAFRPPLALPTQRPFLQRWALDLAAAAGRWRARWHAQALRAARRRALADLSPHVRRDIGADIEFGPPPSDMTLFEYERGRW